MNFVFSCKVFLCGVTSYVGCVLCSVFLCTVFSHVMSFCVVCVLCNVVLFKVLLM